MKIFSLIIMILLLGFHSALATSSGRPLEPNWVHLPDPIYKQGNNYNNRWAEKTDGEVIYAQMLIVYHTEQIRNGKNYISRVSGLAINCKKEAFVVMYDLFYQKKFPNLADTAVEGIDYDLKSSPKIITGKNNIVYRTYCLEMV